MTVSPLQPAEGSDRRPVDFDQRDGDRVDRDDWAEHDLSGLETAPEETTQDLSWLIYIWLGITAATFALALAVAYEPAFDSTSATAMSMLPFVVLALVAATLLGLRSDGLPLARFLTGALAVAGWTVLAIGDDRWTILTFALYAASYSVGRISGLVLSGVLSIAWAMASLVDGSPAWTLIIPFGAFSVGVLISFALWRAGRVNDAQADLIRQLTEAQRNLAASERTKGILEERARFAAEIHDTLAQGFTSIVLLSRAGLRTGDGEKSLTAIEHTAQENLQAARRLVEAIKPPELQTGSLPDALDRHRVACLPPEIRSELRVVGSPRRLTGAVEVTLLRAAQEALLNVRTHAKAEKVDITLSYLDDVVALDVRDDGVGFTSGHINDRGALTGGQGLQVLERRARSLAGDLTIEAMDGGGSVVSVQLPATAQ